MIADDDTPGYTKLEKHKRRKSDFHTSNGFSNLSPPMDTHNGIYAAFILGGAGFLLPYNSFIMAMDYFKTKFPDTTVVYDMSMVYIVFAFLTVLGNNLLVETFSLNSRINFGYLISFITLTFVVICELWWDIFDAATSYTVNLTAVAVVAVGCTVQQSSFYGYTSMLPARYTQAVMVGESASGVFTSLVRVCTRYIVSEICASTIDFFSISIAAVGGCFSIYHLVRRTDFVQFYIALCERAKTRITLEPTEDAGLIETTDCQYGVLKIQSTPPPTGTTLSFTNPAYAPSGSAPTYKVEEVVIRGRTSAGSTSGLSGITRGLRVRWEIIKSIHFYMIAIFLVYYTTISLYPGIASEIVSCNLGSWMPILMVAIFNVADLFGKMLSSISPSSWTTDSLMYCCVLRLFLMPTLILCAIPRSSPFLPEEIFPFTLILMLGLSNGVFGSIPIILAPSVVEDYHRELTGNMMTLSYNFGLTVGSIMAYFWESILDPGSQSCGLNQESNISYILQNLSLSNLSSVSSAGVPDLTTVLVTSGIVVDVTPNSTFEMN